jgi:ATP-dependent RNA helicase SUPV3L1/SUV3
MPISFSSPASRNPRARGAGVTAVLGPTNTGKTHLAIERMLAHSSGIIGLPLRLLAREVYNKCVERVGAENVALVTGEEKIKPNNPRFWVSTVEAMPRDLDVSFVAIDEIQLGADLERGHVFTDRILNRRGRDETLVLGAATMRNIVEKLLPGANILSRPRLSTLNFAGERKLTRLPRRSAIVTFSAAEVYEIAEFIRRQRGGAAVVLGSLSPRTRNAQVALYQSGDVDYLVATDAIGMGLNLDVDHVAFAADRKFDGYQFRKLNPSELGQIAGRAGRATRDGTFGTTGRCPPFEPELAQQIESHAFDSVKVLQWRNTALDFASIGALSASLAEIPTEQGLTRAPIAEDIQVLEHVSRDEHVRALATSRSAIERLWEVCQVPDYRKISPAAHAELSLTLYGFLMREGTLPPDWFAGQVAQADRTDGDIDTLANRIAHIRTWTFAANRPDWLADPEHWQGITRGVEDKLSDALHERLAERFVDRRTSVLMRRLRENTMLETEITKLGEVVVEGHAIGRLAGFQFAADSASAGPEGKALRAAAQKALAGEIETRASRLSHATDEQILLSSDGSLRWQGEPVAKLTAGDDALRPRLRVLSDEHLSGPSRDAVQTRLELWLKTHIEKVLGPLLALSTAEDITGIARGVAFQIAEALGVLDRAKVAEEVKGLEQGDRATLRKHGVRFGAYHVYLPALLKPAPRRLAAQLWALKHGGDELHGLTELQHLAGSGRTSIPYDKTIDKTLYRTVGYRVCGERAVRVDILERLADLIRPALTWRAGSPGMKPAGAIDGFGFTVSGAMTSLTGASGEDFASILRSLGYRMEKRPKPAEPVVAQGVTDVAVSEAPASDATATVEAVSGDVDAAVDVSADVSADAPTDAPAEPASETVAAETVTEASPSVVPEADAPQAETPVAQTADSLPTVAFNDTPPTDPVVESSEPAPEAEPAAEQATDPTEAALAVDASVVDAQAVAEPEMIEVWRPGRPPEERRRPPRRPARPQRAANPAPQAVPAEGTAPPSEAAATPSSPPREREGHRDRGRDRPRSGDQEARPGGPARPRVERKDQPGGQKPLGGQKPWQKKPDRPGGGGGRGRDRGPDVDAADRAQYMAPRGRDAQKGRHEKPADPNSPFAKLAALKEQLEANKERR